MKYMEIKFVQYKKPSLLKRGFEIFLQWLFEIETAVNQFLEPIEDRIEEKVFGPYYLVKVLGHDEFLIRAHNVPHARDKIYRQLRRITTGPINRWQIRAKKYRKQEEKSHEI